MLALPNNLNLQYLFNSQVRDFSDSTPFTFNVINKSVKVETPEGSFNFKEESKLLRFLNSHKTLFTYCPKNKILGLLSLTDDGIYDLYQTGKGSIEGFEVSLLKDNLTIGRTNIYNLAYFHKHKLDTIDEVSRGLKTLIASREDLGIPTTTFTTEAAEAREVMLLFGEIKEEFLSIRRMMRLDPHQDTAWAACYGGRMESRGIGTKVMSDYDMKRAHLQALKEYPGIGDSVLFNERGYDDSDLGCSFYRIIADIPDYYDPGPLRVRAKGDGDCITSPTGRVVGWYFKPYLDLLQTLHIPFRITNAYRFIGSPTYPFKRYMNALDKLINEGSTKFPNISYKHLYSTIAGSTKSIYRTYNKDLAEKQVASRTFAPIIYGFILSWVDTETYKEYLRSNGMAQTIDGHLTPDKNYKPSDLFVCKSSDGEVLMVNPYIKTTPNNGKEIWRDLVKACKDKTYIEAELPFYPSLSTYFTFYETKLGIKCWRTEYIYPSYGARDGRQLGRVGELLEGWHLSKKSDTAKPVTFNPILMNLDKYMEAYHGR